ncbi:hypothetical protein FDECE_18572, partial [Fusarium decemcellulare]
GGGGGGGAAAAAAGAGGEAAGGGIEAGEEESWASGASATLKRAIETRYWERKGGRGLLWIPRKTTPGVQEQGLR